MKPCCALLLLTVAHLLQAGGIELPVTFEANRGQFAGGIRFFAHSPSADLYFSHDAVTIVLAGRRQPVRLRWEGGTAAEPEGREPLGTVSNYLDRNSVRGPVLNVPHFAKVRQNGVYPGIDVLYRVEGLHLEFDLVVAPGADAGRAVMTWEGADRVALDGEGNLEITAGGRRVILRAPVSFQQSGGSRQTVSSAFRKAGSRRAGFLLGPYDHSRELVIDPAVTWGGMFGGTNFDTVNQVARDVAGYLYLVGTSSSNDWAAQVGVDNIFLIKINPLNPPSGATIVYKNFLGAGSGEAVTVDETGNAYVTGYTTSGFRTLAGAWQSLPGGGRDIFYGAYDPVGTQRAGTLLGGGGNDAGNAIVLTHDGQVAIGGYTSSTLLVPSSDAAQQSYGGGDTDGFLMRLNPAGTQRPYFTYLGGSGLEAVQGLTEFAVAGSPLDGSVLAAVGYTYSDNFPVSAGSLQSSRKGVIAGFLTIEAKSGRFASYYGGSTAEFLYQVTTGGPAGDLIATGSSLSADAPVTPGTPSRCCKSSGVLTRWSRNGTFLGATRTPSESDGPDLLANAAILPNGDVVAAAAVSPTLFNPSAAAGIRGAMLVWTPDLKTLKDKLDLGPGVSPLGGALSLYPETVYSLGGQAEFGAVLAGAPAGSLNAGGFIDGFAAQVTFPAAGGPKLRVTQHDITTRTLAPAGSAYNILVTNAGDAIASNVRVAELPRGSTSSNYSIAGRVLTAAGEEAPGGRLFNCDRIHSFNEAPTQFCTASFLNPNETLFLRSDFPNSLTADRSVVVVTSSEGLYETAEPASAEPPVTGRPKRTGFSIGAAGDILRNQVSSAAIPALASLPWARQSTIPGLGAATLQLVVDPNPVAIARQDTAMVNGVPVTIWQAAAGCDFTLSTQANAVSATGGDFAVEVNTNGSCEWVPVTNNGFVTFTGNGAGANGSGTLRYRVAQNGSNTPRTATIRVAGKTLQILQSAAVPASFFADVPSTHAFYAASALLMLGGITNGCGAATYCPDAITTRGQMAVFLVRALLGEDAFSFTPQAYFTDVPANHIFHPWIQKLRDLGITAGCAADRYCPDDPVTRGQMAAFLIRAGLLLQAAEAFPFPTTPSFLDVAPQDTFFRYIQKLKETGITAGCAADLYCPEAPVTRGQMAAFLVRLQAR